MVNIGGWQEVGIGVPFFNLSKDNLDPQKGRWGPNICVVAQGMRAAVLYFELFHRVWGGRQKQDCARGGTSILAFRPLRVTCKLGCEGSSTMDLTNPT